MKYIVRLLIMTATVVMAANASAHDSEPRPLGLLMCEVAADGGIKLAAFDAPDVAVDLRIGMSCMAAASMLRRSQVHFEYNWFDVGGVAKFGIIIINGTPSN